MTQTTATIESEYGSHEIDVVECDSCGNTVAPEEAKPFTLDEEAGHACEHCVEEGPIGFDIKDDAFLRYHPYSDELGSKKQVLLYLGLSPVILVLLMLFTPFYDVEDDPGAEIKLLGLTGWGLFLWVTVFVGVWWVFV